MKILVTGAGGFIGKYLVEHLLRISPRNEIFTICLLPAPSPAVKHFQYDMESEGETHRIIKKVQPDRIYHLAGKSRVAQEITFSQYFSTNYLTTVALLKALERLGKPVEFFFSSSVHVYGNPQEVVSEDSLPHPLGPYGYSKYLAEEALRKKTIELPYLRVVVGRLYNCIGPGQGPGFVAPDLCKKIVKMAMSGGLTLKTGPLSTYRRFLDVRDLVNIIPRLFDVPGSKQFEIYNIASQKELQIGEMLNILLKHASLSPKIDSPDDLSHNEFKGLKLDTGKLDKAVPDIALRPIEETLKDMLKWTQEHWSELPDVERGN